MNDALIGYTGFVGSNLNRQRPFRSLFNSKNINEIFGKSYDFLVCSGAYAEKWRANQNPSQDRKHIDELIKALGAVQADRGVLISTVDVYPAPVDVDESCPVNGLENHAYGKNRGRLESYFLERFSNPLVIRLPGLFGSGLKKNVVFDLMNHNDLDKIDSRAQFQFYGLDSLWRDVQVALVHGLRLVNFATEPVSVREVAKKAFGMAFENVMPLKPARYDFKTLHSGLWMRSDGYMRSKEEVLDEMRGFVMSTQKGMSP